MMEDQFVAFCEKKDLFQLLHLKVLLIRAAFLQTKTVQLIKAFNLSTS